MPILKKSAKFDFTHEITTAQTVLLGSVNVLDTFGTTPNKQAIYTTSLQIWIFNHSVPESLLSSYGAYLASSVYGFRHSFDASFPGDEELVSFGSPDNIINEIVGSRDYLANTLVIEPSGWNIEYYLNLGDNTKSRVAIEIKMIGDE